jgi:hypothetical protein
VKKKVQKTAESHKRYQRVTLLFIDSIMRILQMFCGECVFLNRWTKRILFCAVQKKMFHH